MSKHIERNDPHSRLYAVFTDIQLRNKIRFYVDALHSFTELRLIFFTESQGLLPENGLHEMFVTFFLSGIKQSFDKS